MAKIKIDNLDEGNTILIKGPVRSGQKIEFHGNIVVEGDVNPGAEIVAGGNILIFGALRGMVQSGCHGDEKTTVLALLLLPTQLRIGNHITCPPQGYYGLGGSRPKIARLKKGKVVIETI
ncbi:MAG: septum site-determining protein MinC [Clostridiales bacterium]